MDDGRLLHQGGGYTPAIVTGKPLDLGGAPGREAATGRGVVYAMEAAAKAWSQDLAEMRVAIQGFGNVGSWAARELAERGVKVVAVSDVQGGAFCGGGLDVNELVATTEAGGSVVDAPGIETISNEELIELDCDVLIPAALGKVIRADNAPRVSARWVVEAANYPVTPEGDEILRDRNVRVIPDILANGGGVTGSYFEWTQNIQQFTWKETRFNEELRDHMQRAFDLTEAFATEHRCSLRQAAFALAIQRVAHTAHLRGYV